MIKPAYIFCVLCSLFLIYSTKIYLTPWLNKNEQANYKIEKAAEGRLVWQKYNCQSCHQLYGLGGYLGPDLTNICSDSMRGEVLIRTLVKSGVKQMPACKMSESELVYLIEFLKSVNASGKSDTRLFKINSIGMIERHEKK